MNRLQKKCLIVTAGFHLLLLLVLVFGSAFFSARNRPDDSQVLDMIPANLADATVSSGVRGAQPPPPAPAPPQPQAVVTPPAPPQKVQPPEPVKSTEPDVTKPPEHVIKPDLTHVVVRTVPKNFTPQKSADDERQQKLQQQRDRAIAAAIRNLKKNLTSATVVDMPGNSTVAYANYASVVKSVYELAWTPPDSTDSDDANTKVKVTIASDGTVITASIVTPSGDASVDASVQKTLDRVTFIAPFPDGAKETERTYIINFNLKSKRMLG
jgi:TonB family protein